MSHARRTFAGFILPISIILTPSLAAASDADCSHRLSSVADSKDSHSSFNEIVSIMSQRLYDPSNLPVIPIRMFRWIGKRLVFTVGQRSNAILRDKADYRTKGADKPIHPMGVGLLGTMELRSSRWSGIFRGGRFPVVARASISQGNPFKWTRKGGMQVRSTAMALKVFGTNDRTQDGRTANAVFQNNLNGLLGVDGQPLNYLESVQTNQPGLAFSKIAHLYEIQTLIGIAYASIVNAKDHMSRVPFINPQIRPVHSWAELGEIDPSTVRTPTWVKIDPKLPQPPVMVSDFRLEIFETMKRDGFIEYELSASDRQDSSGKIIWENVGTIVFDQAILSAAVDQNLLFPHDTLNSKFTGINFEIPPPDKQWD